MGRQSDPRKAVAWEQRIARFGNSGLTTGRRRGASVVRQNWTPSGSSILILNVDRSAPMSAPLRSEKTTVR